MHPTDLPALLGDCLGQLLRRPELAVALRQRAKFEGWLKIEFAHLLEQRGCRVTLEAGTPTDRGRVVADLLVEVPGLAPALVMLKTNNTNFRFPDVASGTRPVTKNVEATAQDVEKLRTACQGNPAYVVFPLFPVASSPGVRARQVERHLARLRAGGRARLLREGFVVPPCSSGAWGIAWYIVAPA